MIDQENGLPDGWIKVQLDEIVNIVRGVSFPKETKASQFLPNHIACLRTTNVQKNVEWDDLWYIPRNIVKRDEQFIQLEDILISTANSYELVGKVALVKKIVVEATLGAFISLIRPSNLINKRFVYYQLAWSDTQDKIRQTASTTTNISNVSTKKLAFLDVLLPPFLEQHRIVAEIEKQFSRLDEAVAGLKRIQANLKRYRASVLKSAVEGKLTAEWRKQHPDTEPAEQLLQRILKERRAHWEQAELKKMQAAGKPHKDELWKQRYKEPVKPNVSDLPVLPEGWAWTNVSYVIDEPRYGTSKKCTYERPGIAVLRIPNIIAGSIDVTDLKYAVFSEEEIEAYSLNEGDILIIRSNGSISIVGKCARVTKKEEKYLYAGYLIRLRPYQNINSKYLLNCFYSSFLRNQIEDKAKSTSGVNNVNANELKSLIIPTCTLDEQAQIVSEVERRLSIADEVEQQINASLKRAERMRQSILKKAFSGRLVPQDPNDETADILLEKVKQAQRA